MKRTINNLCAVWSTRLYNVILSSPTETTSPIFCIRCRLACNVVKSKTCCLKKTNPTTNNNQHHPFTFFTQLHSIFFYNIHSNGLMLWMDCSVCTSSLLTTMDVIDFISGVDWTISVNTDFKTQLSSKPHMVTEKSTGLPNFLTALTNCGPINIMNDRCTQDSTLKKKYRENI